MKPRNLLILLLVVLALAAFLWFVERDLPGTEEREEMAGRVIPGLETDEVTALTLEVGEERVRLERRENGDAADGGEAEDGEAEDAAGAEADWRFTAPERFAGSRADAAAVDDLLSALAGLDKESTVEGAEPADVGLDAPRARVVLERAADEPITLLVGGEVPASSNMIVGREDADGAVAADVFVVHHGIFTDLDKDAGDWRARDLFPAVRDEVERIALSRPAGDAMEGGDVVLVRRDGGFDVVEPLADRADREAVDALLAALAGLTAESFLDDVTADGLAELGLDPPRGTVGVETAGGGEPFVLRVGAPTDGGSLHLQLGDQVVTARTALLEALERPVAGWPSRSLTGRRVFEIQGLTVEDSDGTLTLERSSPDWLRDGERVSYTPVSDLLYGLTDARADETLPVEGLRLRAPEVTVTLTTEAADGGEGEGEEAPAAEQETIALHPAGDDGRTPATVAGRDRVLLLPAEAAAEIRDALAAVRAAEPLPEEDPEDGNGELPEGVEVEVEEGP